MFSAATIAAVFVLSAGQPGDAQQRKSLRWATSSVDSYGYQVAASMTKLVEDALGGEYTVTVNPYPQTTSATKAAMDGEAEIGYTADIGMREVYDGASGFRNYTPAKAKLVHTPPRRSWCTHGTPIRWNRSWRRRPTRPTNTSA